MADEPVTRSRAIRDAEIGMMMDAVLRVSPRRPVRVRVSKFIPEPDDEHGEMILLFGRTDSHDQPEIIVRNEEVARLVREREMTFEEWEDFANRQRAERRGDRT